MMRDRIYASRGSESVQFFKRRADRKLRPALILVVFNSRRGGAGCGSSDSVARKAVIKIYQG